jgi:hypothetical protein
MKIFHGARNVKSPRKKRRRRKRNPSQTMLHFTRIMKK